MGFRFLHLADLHLETRFGGRPDTRERLRQATHEAFTRAVDHAIEHRLDALLAPATVRQHSITLGAHGALLRR